MRSKPEPLRYEIFDHLVTNFVTARIFRILYAAIIALLIVGVGGAEFGLTRSSGFPFWAVALLGVAIPIVACLIMLLFRMSFELTLIFFRTEEHLREMRADSTHLAKPPTNGPGFFERT